MDNTVSRRVVW